MDKTPMRNLNKFMINKLFVTVGTTSFDDLITEICKDSFFEAISKMGVTDIIIQIGAGNFDESIDGETRHGVRIKIYRFKPSLMEDMEWCDAIISHAGSGTILEGLWSKKKILVVVNESLMDNHQIELAEKMNSEKYLVSGTPRNILEKLEVLANTNLKKWKKIHEDKIGKFIENYQF